MGIGTSHDTENLCPPDSASNGSGKRPRIESAADVHESDRIAAATAAITEEAAGPRHVLASALPTSQGVGQLIHSGTKGVEAALPEQHRGGASAGSEKFANCHASESCDSESGMAPGYRLLAGDPQPEAEACARSCARVGPKPYLCTGFDCYVVREPCVMCAMALVHSRVQRVIYAEADPEHGALGGSLKLHGQQSLNHHYSVYHMAREPA